MVCEDDTSISSSICSQQAEQVKGHNSTHLAAGRSQTSPLYAGFTPDAEATPKRGVNANPWRAGAWLVTPDARKKIDSTPKRSLHGARQPRHNATLQPPVCSALRFNMGVDGSQRIGAAPTPRFGVASASGVNPA
ncbi:unnamed protein product [Pleuronectes platessa]|uniref:Uncharacterized protein n=1 Tax=Pleuronectes platessa TaxID=8262 RepID=A0A9N7VFC9_PLEPL|nr:unnamed protein product [Pleuronectes platessa]